MLSILLISPTYNEGHRVSTLIESLQSQTFTDWVIVFGDNASDDASTFLIGNAALNDSRIQLKSFKNHVTGDQNFLRTYQFARTIYSANYAGFVGGDDKYEDSDYLMSLYLGLQAGNEMAIPAFTSLIDSQKTRYLLTTNSPWKNQVLLAKDWNYVCAIYSLFSQSLLDDLMRMDVSKPNSRIGFDWWFVFTAFQLAGQRVCSVSDARYFKFNKHVDGSGILPTFDLVSPIENKSGLLKLFKGKSRNSLYDIRWLGFLMVFVLQNRKKFASISPIKSLKVVFFLITSQRPV